MRRCGRAGAAARRMSRGAALHRGSAMFVVLVASVGVNIYQYVDQKQRAAGAARSDAAAAGAEAGGRATDPTLKEVNYAEQLHAPARISTEADREQLLAGARRAASVRRRSCSMSASTPRREMGTLARRDHRPLSRYQDVRHRLRQQEGDPVLPQRQPQLRNLRGDAEDGHRLPVHGRRPGKMDGRRPSA